MKEKIEELEQAINYIASNIECFPRYRLEKKEMLISAVHSLYETNGQQEEKIKMLSAQKEELDNIAQQAINKGLEIELLRKQAENKAEMYHGDSLTWKSIAEDLQFKVKKGTENPWCESCKEENCKVSFVDSQCEMIRIYLKAKTPSSCNVVERI